MIVYVRRTPREDEVLELLGGHMIINRIVHVDAAHQQMAKELAILGLIDIRFL
jgi:hypothetical protein